jgi:branched-chain amino acid aminotransferase
MDRRAVTFFDGAWHEGNPGLLGPMSHGMWMASVVFDGARAMQGRTPDLDRHCQRVCDSAEIMGLVPPVDAATLEAAAREGAAKFATDADLYIRPMMWAESGFVAPDPESTRWCVTVHESPMPEPTGFSAMLSTKRRASPESMPTLAKASCLYPQAALALAGARKAGYDNAVMCDMLGNVAELATANLWLAKDGAVHTPIPNGTFLNGITRQRVIDLLRADGVTVIERTIRPEELETADELFSTGNYGKVMPLTRLNGRDLQPGPMYRKARALYFDYALGA